MNTCSSQGITTLMVLVTVALASVSACEFGDTCPAATIGERLVLPCDLGCFDRVYKWYLINNTLNMTLPETSSELVVSENVTSAAEVGGRLYECHCLSVADCRAFRIGVRPVAHLHISNEVVKLGSGVNITCTAESYPRANRSSNYLLKHPWNTSISQEELLSGKNGVVHTITAAKDIDEGEYECTVTVTLEEYPNHPLQSNNEIAKLTVYDAPLIVSVRNSTVSLDPDVEQSVFLECAVSNTENDLEVWVNWTAGDGEAIKKKHIEFRKADVFFLLLYNVSADDYICQVFSSYSPDKPEDQRSVAVLVSVLTPKTEDSNCMTVVAASISASLLIVACTIVIEITVILYVKRQQRKMAGTNSSGGIELQNTASRNSIVVNGGTPENDMAMTVLAAGHPGVQERQNETSKYEGRVNGRHHCELFPAPMHSPPSPGYKECLSRCLSCTPTYSKLAAEPQD